MSGLLSLFYSIQYITIRLLFENTNDYIDLSHHYRKYDDMEL